MPPQRLDHCRRISASRLDLAMSAAWLSLVEAAAKAGLRFY